MLVKYTNDAKGRLFNDNLPFVLEQYVLEYAFSLRMGIRDKAHN